MNGINLFIDTNIVLYLLAGDNTLATILDGKEVYVSYITEMGLLSYNNLSIAEENRINIFLADATIIEMSLPIKQKAIQIRKTTGMKLPDSIIAASALKLNIPLLTADKGFKNIPSLTYLHYEK
ncbi:MAG: type II toxin-antitoxin system VapC family toxin [Chitinophagaceae bacterium]|jgi:predicted nucleic acid-binding protein|nr:type II toxin-antitoxin system VapC family toxin [Chitinophagaceae bacterium]